MKFFCRWKIKRGIDIDSGRVNTKIIASAFFLASVRDWEVLGPWEYKTDHINTIRSSKTIFLRNSNSPLQSIPFKFIAINCPEKHQGPFLLPIEFTLNWMLSLVKHDLGYKYLCYELHLYRHTYSACSARIANEIDQIVNSSLGWQSVGRKQQGVQNVTLIVSHFNSWHLKMCWFVVFFLGFYLHFLFPIVGKLGFFQRYNCHSSVVIRNSFHNLI